MGFRKIDPVNTEDIKSEQDMKTEMDSRGREDANNTINTVSFAKQENQVKQDQHEDIDNKIIQALKKLDLSYNTDSLNHINYKFKDMILEDMSQEKALIHQEQAYGEPQNFQEAWNHEDP